MLKFVSLFLSIVAHAGSVNNPGTNYYVGGGVSVNTNGGVKTTSSTPSSSKAANQSTASTKQTNSGNNFYVGGGVSVKPSGGVKYTESSGRVVESLVSSGHTTTTTYPAASKSTPDQRSASPVDLSSLASSGSGGSQDRRTEINYTVSQSAVLAGKARTMYENSVVMITKSIKDDKDWYAFEKKYLIDFHSKVAYEGAVAAQNVLRMDTYTQTSMQNAWRTRGWVGGYGARPIQVGNPFSHSLEMQRAFYKTTNEIYSKSGFSPQDRVTPTGPIDYITRYSRAQMSEDEKNAMRVGDALFLQGKIDIIPPSAAGGTIREQNSLTNVSLRNWSWNDLTPIQKLGMSNSLTLVGEKSALIEFDMVQTGYINDPEGYKRSLNIDCGNRCGSDPNEFWAGLATSAYDTLPGIAGGVLYVSDKSGPDYEAGTIAHEYEHAGIKALRALTSLQIANMSEADNNSNKLINLFNQKGAADAADTADLRDLAPDIKEFFDTNYPEETYYTHVTEYFAFRNTNPRGQDDYLNRLQSELGMTPNQAHIISEFLETHPAVMEINQQINEAAQEALKFQGIE